MEKIKDFLRDAAIPIAGGIIGAYRDGDSNPVRNIVIKVVMIAITIGRTI